MINNPAVGVVASCDQHKHLGEVPPFAQYRAYEVPGLGEVTVMIGAPFAGSHGEQNSLFRVYLPDGTGTQGVEWPDYVGGDPASALSAWLLMSMVLEGLSTVDDPVVSEAASRVVAYASEQADRLQSEPQDYAPVLRQAAPVGTTVFVQDQAPGWVRVWVEIGDRKDGVTHRVINPTGVNHITARAASLLGVEYSPDRDALRGDAGVVGRLGLRLHGGTGCLFTASL